jgi:predicted phosphodiesterase
MDRPAGTKLTRRSFMLGLAGLGLLSWTLSPAGAYQPFEPFSFAYITDVHLCNDKPDSYVLTHESQLFLQQLVKELNSQKLDFVVFGGDQVESIGKDETNWQLFLDVVQGLNAPWSFVLGEADVSGNYSVDKRKTFGPDWKQRGIDTETSYWSHNLSQMPNVHLIGLDSSMPNSTVGGVSQKQLDWLKQDLEANKKYFTIVFVHHPLLPPPPYDSGPPWDEYVIPDGGSVREVLAAYPNVKMVLSGHIHVSKVQNEQEIWHISSPSLSVFPCAYRIFNVTPNAVTMETRQIGFPALVKKGRKDLIDSALASRFSKTDPGTFLSIVEGTKDDQNAIIPMLAGKALMPYNPKKVKKEEAPKQEEPKKEKKKKKDKQSEVKQPEVRTEEKSPEVKSPEEKPPEEKSEPAKQDE